MRNSSLKIRRIFPWGQYGGMLKTVNPAFDECLPAPDVTYIEICLLRFFLIYWSQALRNATGHLSAICCWCVFLWSKTSQNRPSHSRLNLKIFAVPYLGQNSSKFPPKPLLVEKLVSRTVYCRHFWGQYFQSAALNFATQCVPNRWARKHAKIQRICPLRDRREYKSHEIRCPRFLAMK